MTIKTADRVFETSITTGTGTLTLQGPVTGFQSFITGVGTGAKVPYTIFQEPSSWECGIGTVTSGGSDTLSRTTVLASSNGGVAVNFGSGTKNVYLGFNAGVVPVRDENLNFIEGFGAVTGTANALLLTLTVAPKAYSDGMIIRGFATASNTTITTINVNSLGVKTLKQNGVDLAGNALVSGTYFEGVYKSSTGFFELTTPIPIASSAAPGIVEFAIDAEFQTGTATDRVITPANVKNCLGFSKYFESTEQTFANTATAAHGLGVTPKIFEAFLICKITERVYAVGDLIPLTNNGNGVNYSSTTSVNATTCYASFSTAATYRVTNRDASGEGTLTAANWRVIFKCWA